MATLKVFTFPPDWGLPTVGPFALKLLAWLELAGLPYEQVYEANPRKGPKGKNPWIELDGVRIGDSEVIIDLLKARHAVQLDEELSAEQLATGHAWRRTFEEHYHQVLEWELFFHPAGATWMRGSLASQMPAVLAGPVFSLMRSQFRKQLYARGIARHDPEVITRKGRADLDALSAFLGDSPFLLADRPNFRRHRGLWPARADHLLVHGHAGRHARALTANLKAYCDRMREGCFARK